MKALTNILTYMLLMLLLLIPASCTEETAEVDNLSRQEEYVSVRINIPSMKSATTRADDEAEDNLTSIVALVFRDDALVSKTEVTTAESTLIPSTSTTGTFNIPRPKSGDVIHFLGNLPSGVTLPEVGASESALCSLETGEREKLSYWGKATYDGGNIDVTLYRHLAKIEIAAGEDCTFPKDELFIAGLINANTKGKLVPYDEENETFNFNLADHDYPTAVSSPLAETDELTNYGAGYSTSYYVFEHDNPETSDGLYVICKFGDIGKCYYKVALTSDGKTPYKIIRNHRYVIYVNDLDEGVGSYTDALTADPINLEVKEMKDVTLTVADNPTVYLNGGEDSTLPVALTVPDGSELTQLQITAPNFTIKQDDSQLTQDANGVYSFSGTMEGVTTNYTFIPNSGLIAGTYTISFKGSGNYLNAIDETISVKVDATMMSVSPATATINMDENANASATLTLTKPGNVSNVNVTQSADVFKVTNTGNDYTFTPENSTIAAGEYTITFSDSNYPQVSATAAITVVNTPTVAFTNTGSQSIKLNGSHTVTMTVPEGKTLSDFSITVNPATGLSVSQNGNSLTLTDGVYNTTSGVSEDQTFTFTPSATGTYTVTFSGSGEDVKMPDETLTLEVSAAAVTTMSVEAVDGDSTIDMDSGDTNVTFTLTKPSSVGQLNIAVADANSTNVKNNFSITADGQSPWNNNDNDDVGYYYNVNNNSETVTITVALKNGFNTAGTYTITISDYNKTMSTTATITIKKTPTVSFSNTSDQILYWNNGSPTSFDVEMTGVPEGGSVSLSFKDASAFTITLPDGTIVSDTYTYTGGNTIFTITPKDANSVSATAYTITITGSGEGVIVTDASIKVTVEDEEPEVTETTLWNYTGDGTGQQLNPYNHFDGDNNIIDISNIEEGDTLGFDFSINTYNANTYILIMNNGMYMALSSQFAIAEGKTNYEHKITADDYTTLMHNNNKTLGVRGSENVYLTRVYLKKKN